MTDDEFAVLGATGPVLLAVMVHGLPTFEVHDAYDSAAIAWVNHVEYDNTGKPYDAFRPDGSSCFADLGRYYHELLDREVKAITDDAVSPYWYVRFSMADDSGTVRQRAECFSTEARACEFAERWAAVIGPHAIEQR